MVLDQLGPVGSLIGALSLTEASTILTPLVFFVIWMAIFSIFVFKFYRFIARRDVFRLSQGGRVSTAARIGYALEYLFLFPIIAFVWFFVISVLLSVLSTSPLIVIDNIFLVSVAILITIRITAYHHEELSRDIAKLIPFALLAVLILQIVEVDVTIVWDTFADLIQIFQQVAAGSTTLVYYFIFITVLEWILRLVTHRRSPPEANIKPTPKKQYGKASQSNLRENSEGFLQRDPRLRRRSQRTG